jgi:hypothetical protein
MDRWSRSLLIGMGLLAVLALGFVMLAASWHIDRAYRHLVVEVNNINDIGRVNVDCQRAATVSADEGPRTIDLGYLSPDDRVALSAFNEIGDSAWGFRVISNGRTVFDQERGRARAAGFPAEEHAVVMAKSITADGDMLGTIGCDPPLVVSPDLTSYSLSPDDGVVTEKKGVRQPWQAPKYPYALIKAVAAWVLPLLALIGFVAAAATPGVRTRLRRYWKISLAITATGLLLTLRREFGLDGLILSIEMLGGAALLFAAAVNIWVGLVVGGIVFQGFRET